MLFCADVYKRQVVDEALIPALDIVGAKYEKGTLFLPQLLVGNVQLVVYTCGSSGAHGVVLAVTANGDGALQVGAVHIHPGVPQDAQRFLVRVAVLVVHAAEMCIRDRMWRTPSAASPRRPALPVCT